ncbi:MAG TPA: SDR family oxidoreductase, partial [Dehalococcoidia bacterium]
MAGGLSGKVAIVTGGNSGIGAATVMRFAREGARVAILARREPEGLAVQQAVLTVGGEARFIGCDVTDRAALEAAVRRTVELYGGVNVLVNNAGGGIPDPFPEANDDAFERTLCLNLTSAYILARACWPHLVAAGGGTVVNVTSLAAVTAVSPHQQSIMPFFPSAGYMASKAGLEGLTRYLASAGAPYNIRVNAVRPGAVLTPQATRLQAGHHVFERVHEEVQLTPGSGAPEDVANAIYYLASDESKFVNAQILSVDGGA